MARRVKVDLVGDASHLNRAFKSAGLHAEKFGHQASRTRRIAGAAFSGLEVGAVAVAGIGIASVKAAATYQEQMDKIVGLSGVGRKQMQKFTKQVLALAPALGKSPQELAKALYFITSSGVKASQAMGVLIASSKASTAGLGETEVVADAVTSAMNAYGPSVVNAKKATDVLVATVREGKGEASSFAGVIGNVAAVAAQLGVSFNDVGAALAAQTRLGIDAQTAATQLSAFFSSLLKTSPSAAKAMGKFGLSAAGLRRELKEKGLLATLQTIKSAFGDNTAAMAKAFPNVRALRGVLALVGKQAGSTAGVFDRMADSTGSLNTAFGAVRHSANFRFAQLGASLKVLAITLGTALLPMVEKFTRDLARWLSKAKNQRKMLHDIRVAVKIMAGTISVAVKVIAAIVTVTQGYIRVGRRVVTWTKRMGDTFKDTWASAKKHTMSFYNWIQRTGIKIALAIIEPFSHLPGFLGGKKFQKAKEELQGQLQALTPGKAAPPPKHDRHGNVATPVHGAIRAAGGQLRAPGAEGRHRPRHEVHEHNIVIELDGKPVRHNVKSHDRRSKRRTTAQRGGRHAGTVLD